MDIVDKVFDVGEVKAVSTVLIESVGAGKKLNHAIIGEAKK